jgi:hypothetical protein
MQVLSVQLASEAQISSIGPFTLNTPPTTTRHNKRIRASRKKPVLGGVRAILFSALVGSAIWYLIWEAGKHLLFGH